MKPSKLLSDPSKWTKSAIARDANGGLVSDGTAREAVSWCIVGALDKCKYSSAIRIAAVKDLHNLLPPAYTNIAMFNDHPKTTYDDILTLLLAADL